MQYVSQHQQFQYHREQQRQLASSRVSPTLSSGGKTYADYFSDSPAAAGTQSRGPVRITISKSAHYTIDPSSGLPRYEEVWEEEEIMDVAVPEQNGSPTTDLNPQVSLPGPERPDFRQSAKSASSRSPNKTAFSPPAGLTPRHASEDDKAPQGRELDAKAEEGHQMVSTSSFIQIQQSSTGLHAVNRGPSLMVLDTNTLIASFVFLRTLFSLLLVRNLNALLLRSVWPPNVAIPSDLRPAPFRLVLPHIVIQELDGLKSHDDDAGAKARQANRWILACLQAQKRTVSAFLTESSSALIMKAALRIGANHAQVVAAAETVLASTIPPEAWALHFETSRQYRDRVHKEERRSSERKTNDERIVELCVSLASSTSLPVWLLSNDTNARTHAEIEGIRALELDNIIREPTKPPPPAFATSAMDNTPDWAKAGHDGVRYSAQPTQKREVSDINKAAQELIEQWDAQVGYADDDAMDGHEVLSGRQGGNFGQEPFSRARSPVPAYRSSSPSVDEDGDESMDF
ncbi:Origin recognition complex subunit 2 [Tilletia horrida]|uniref:Origin recognition complex subunit 2 n=1 Tax=Tilletia horrida TaxID=155126 RepID=A0AAN6JRH5_9BASI|nr:Origin recognition complex subunit 2 [Tilletia horrida]KAK0562719.1 Origin recognition complex subunit 2 [Tilletia horrida]